MAVGDYNFDWQVNGGDTDHDAGFDALTEDNIFVWIRPATLIRTQCSAHDSVLDFVFVAGPAREWGPRARSWRPSRPTARTTTGPAITGR